MSVACRSLHSVAVVALASLAIPQAFANAPSIPAVELARCAAISAAPQRLSCYDELAASILPARSNAAVARSGAVTPGSDTSSFGLPPPQLAHPASPPSIRAHLQWINGDSYGDTVVRLDNGQTWKVQEGQAPLSRGESVTIRRAALGSFLMTTSDRRSYRVKRLQ